MDTILLLAIGLTVLVIVANLQPDRRIVRGDVPDDYGKMPIDGRME